MTRKSSSTSLAASPSSSRRTSKKSNAFFEVQASNPVPDNGRPYILESDEFRAMVYARRNEAEGEIKTLEIEVERIHIEICNLQARIANLEVEASARLARREDLTNLIASADAALGTRRTVTS